MRLRGRFAAWVAVTAIAAGPTHASVPETGRGPSDSVLAIVGYSEWCPPGNVRLDLRTGRYTVRAPASWRVCRRPAYRSRVRTAVLGADALAAVRAAFQRAVAQGLETPACRSGDRPRVSVVSNGGFPMLRLTSGGRTIAAPVGLDCWSDAARKLTGVLQILFSPRADGNR